MLEDLFDMLLPGEQDQIACKQQGKETRQHHLDSSNHRARRATTSLPPQVHFASASISVPIAASFMTCCYSHLSTLSFHTCIFDCLMLCTFVRAAFTSVVCASGESSTKKQNGSSIRNPFGLWFRKLIYFHIYSLYLLL
jgi:hypothetical protein